MAQNAFTRSEKVRSFDPDWYHTIQEWAQHFRIDRTELQELIGRWDIQKFIDHSYVRGKGEKGYFYKIDKEWRDQIISELSELNEPQRSRAQELKSKTQRQMIDVIDWQLRYTEVKKTISERCSFSCSTILWRRAQNVHNSSWWFVSRQVYGGELKTYLKAEYLEAFIAFCVAQRQDFVSGTFNSTADKLERFRRRKLAPPWFT